MPQVPSPLLSRWRARASDDRVVTYDAGGSTSWRHAVDASERTAASLLGGRASLDGDRVALLVSPGASFVAAFFGVLRAGGTAVVLSPLHPPPETKFLCDDARAHAVLASPDLLDRVVFLAPERRIWTTEDAATGLTGKSPADPTDDQPALQLYTSGTTGKPKGAVLTYANLAVQQGLLREAWGLREDDVLLHVLPLHHMHGLVIALLSTIAAGAATRFVGGGTRFDAMATWEAMENASVFMAVPTIHAKLFAAFDAADGPTRDRWGRSARSLRLVTSGSAALPVAVGNRWLELTGAYPLERFGMTEIGVGMSNPLASAGRRPGTVGTPLPTVKMRVVDEGGRAAETGELWIAGPSVFDRYHDRPEATREAFVVEGGERWFKTGDTVACDPDGFVRVLGRTSVDILKSGGYKLSALEIEGALLECGAVAEVAVVGVADAAWGERVVACVVPRAGKEDECSEERIRGFAKERLAAYKVPRQVVVMRDLPRNALGKVLKRELAKRLTD
ncbi:MAG: AMP-binding protein [Polyangiaceae bacterium]